ncbi:hypothetical protein, partial [Xanthomonas oryzae]|uniref:hypothetical protein n=1 Tax=Xanthomonas oryzae TaxID=347 RepID=UPI003CCFE45A
MLRSARTASQDQCVEHGVAWKDVRPRSAHPMNHPNLLTALNQSGALRTLDLAFAQSLQRLEPET